MMSSQKAIVTFHSLKGGSGKTTMALALTAYLARDCDMEVCYIDLDIPGAGTRFQVPTEPVSKAEEPVGEAEELVGEAEEPVGEAEEYIEQWLWRRVGSVPGAVELVTEALNTGKNKKEINAIAETIENDFPYLADNPPKLRERIREAVMSNDEVTDLLRRHTGADRVGDNARFIFSDGFPGDDSTGGLVLEAAEERYSSFFVYLLKLLKAIPRRVLVLDCPPGLDGLSRMVLTACYLAVTGDEKELLFKHVPVIVAAPDRANLLGLERDLTKFKLDPNLEPRIKDASVQQFEKFFPNFIFLLNRMLMLEGNKVKLKADSPLPKNPAADAIIVASWVREAFEQPLNGVEKLLKGLSSENRLIGYYLMDKLLEGSVAADHPALSSLATNQLGKPLYKLLAPILGLPEGSDCDSSCR
jgi:hypothetical protein